jgi:hypothetical protein
MRKISLLLIIFMLIITGILSGCNEQSSDGPEDSVDSTEETSMIDIKEDPDKYINQTVTVRAEYNGTYGNYHYIKDSNITLRVTESDDIVKPSSLVLDSTYLWTGTVRYYLGVYLEVTKIKAI